MTTKKPRPQKRRCQRCNHVESFHSVRLGGCQVVACSGGGEGSVCESFVAPDEDQSPEAEEALSL